MSHRLRSVQCEMIKYDNIAELHRYAQVTWIKPGSRPLLRRKAIRRFYVAPFPHCHLQAGVKFQGRAIDARAHERNPGIVAWIEPYCSRGIGVKMPWNMRRRIIMPAHIGNLGLVDDRSRPCSIPHQDTDPRSDFRKYTLYGFAFVGCDLKTVRKRYAPPTAASFYESHRPPPAAPGRPAWRHATNRDQSHHN